MTCPCTLLVAPMAECEVLLGSVRGGHRAALHWAQDGLCWAETGRNQGLSGNCKLMVFRHQHGSTELMSAAGANSSPLPIPQHIPRPATGSDAARSSPLVTLPGHRFSSFLQSLGGQEERLIIWFEIQPSKEPSLLKKP